MSKTRKEVPVLPLEGDLTIACVETHRKALIEAFAAGSGAALRFEDVGDADLAFIQLLCSAHRTFHNAGQSLTLEGTVPAPFMKVLKDANITACSCGVAVKECIWKLEGV